MKHLVIISVGVFFLAAIWVVARAGMNPARSVSLHASTTRVSRVGFGILVSVATVLLGYQIFSWLLPKYYASIVSRVLFGLILGCFGVAAFVPHVVGTWREPVHNSVAWGLVGLIPLTMAFMLLWPLASTAWWMVATLTVTNSVLLLVALLRYEKFRPKFLYFQVAYLAIFFTALVVATYC
jgi:hypothetical protein